MHKDITDSTRSFSMPHISQDESTSGRAQTADGERPRPLQSTDARLSSLSRAPRLEERADENEAGRLFEGPSSAPVSTRFDHKDGLSASKLSVRGPIASGANDISTPQTVSLSGPPKHHNLGDQLCKTISNKMRNAVGFLTPGGASRLDWNTPFTAHSRVGETTTLRDYAEVKETIEQTAGTRIRGTKESEDQSSPLKENPELRLAMDALRTKLVSSTLASATSPADQRMRLDRLPEHTGSALAFWKSPDGLALATKVCRDPDVFQAHIDAMATAHSPEIALAVSLALVSSKEIHDPRNTALLTQDIFTYLKHADLRSEIADAKAHSDTSPGIHIRELRATLEQIRDNLMANRCEPLDEESSPGSSKIDHAAFMAFTKTVRNLPIAMRMVAQRAPQALFSWPGMRDGAARFDAHHAEAAATCLSDLDVLASEFGAKQLEQTGSATIIVSKETARKIRNSQEALLSFVSTPFHLHEYDALLKQAEAGRAIAWGGLQRASITGGFDEMLAATENRGLAAPERNHLRLYLQASAAASAAMNAKPTPEALIAARLTPHAPISNAANFALRVSDACAKIVTQGAGLAVLNPSDKADLLAWRNGFTDDAPGSDLSKLKQRFYKVLTWVDRQNGDQHPVLLRKHKSPLSAARNGIEGGDRSVLSVEQKKMSDQLAKPEVNAVVKTVAEAMESMYASKSTVEAPEEYGETRDPTSLSDAHCAWIALRVALEDWMPEHASERTLNQLILGRQFAPDALSEQVNQRVREHAELAVSKAMSCQPEEVERTVQHVVARVGKELANVRLGFEELDSLANFLHVERGENFDNTMNSARNIASALPRKPTESTPESVRNMLVDYLKEIPGGNTVRLSHGVSKGISTKGISRSLVKASTRLAGIPIAATGRVDLRYEGARDAVVSMALPVHAAELFIGTEKRHRGRIGVGGFLGAKLFKFCRAGFNVDASLYEHERTDATGIMLRIPRTNAAQDGNVRNLFSRVADFIFTSAKARNQSNESLPNADAFFRTFADEFYADENLSLSWIAQKTRAHRSEFSAGIGASAVQLLDKNEQQTGLLGIGLGYAFEKQWGAMFTQLDETGSYRILNLRRQKYTRHKLNLPVTAAAVTGKTGDSTADLFGGTSILNENGAQVKLRLFLKHDNLLPMKSVADIEFDSAREYIRYIESTKNEWVGMFAYRHRNEPDGGQAKALQEVNEHIETIKHLNTGYNSFYARRYLTEDAANTLNSLDQLSRLTPKSEKKLQEKIATECQKTLNAPSSWLPVGLRSYEKYAAMDGFKVSAALQYAQTTGLRIERQMVFDTIGPALLKERELALKAAASEVSGRTGSSAQAPEKIETTTAPTSVEASSQSGKAKATNRNAQAGTSEIELARENSVDTLATNMGATHQGTSFGDTSKKPSGLSAARDSAEIGGAPREKYNVNADDEKNRHLKNIKRSLDARAGIDPNAKKNSSLLRSSWRGNR